MATRTAKGLASSKDTGTTVTLSSVSVTATHSVFAFVTFHDATLPTSVKAGTRDMNKVLQRINATSGFGVALYYTRSLKNTNTRDFVATWAATPGARSISVTTVDVPMLFFEGAGNTSTSASPTTSANLLDLPVHDCFHFAAHVAQGPTNDVALTFDADWTAGQRGGTAGVPPVSNITINEAFKFGRCIDAEECPSTGTDSRDYCSLLGSFKPLIDDIPVDVNGAEIETGDTVSWDGGTSTSTVSSITHTIGHAFVKVTLANGAVYNSHMLEIQ